MLGLRSLRLVINSVVPVVGGALSEGLISIQSYSSLIKSSVGVVGIAAIVLVFLPAVLETALWRAVLTLLQTVGDVFGDSNVSAVVGVFRDALLIVNAVLIVSALTAVISFGVLIAAHTS